ncbi:hypothetical protein B0H11DRAFT_1919969 [Mycena galericulata]|nr:hypothetical protein B0H11DRAFT_1919969 [Mycena galericulata]
MTWAVACFSRPHETVCRRCLNTGDLSCPTAERDFSAADHDCLTADDLGGGVLRQAPHETVRRRCLSYNFLSFGMSSALEHDLRPIYASWKRIITAVQLRITYPKGYKSSHPRRPKVENGHPFEASRIGEVSRSPHDGLAVGVRVGRSQRVVLKARRTVPHICNIASVFLTSSPPIAIEAHGGNGCWERNVWDGASPKQRQPAEKQKQRVPCRSPGKASPRNITEVRSGWPSGDISGVRWPWPAGWSKTSIRKYGAARRLELKARCTVPHIQVHSLSIPIEAHDGNGCREINTWEEVDDTLKFPAYELVDLVIDEVAATQSPLDIGTCGRISKQWLPRSRTHLFRSISLSSADSTAIQGFLDLVEASSTPFISLVRSVEIHHTSLPFREEHMARLQRFHAVQELSIHGPLHARCSAMARVEDLRFQRWLRRHIPRFGSTCPSLTSFQLLLTSDISIRILADVILRLPSLTLLRICGDSGEGGKYGLLTSDPIPSTCMFPRQLRTLDLELFRGTNLFFEWLLSHNPFIVLTTLKLGGIANGAPLRPIEEYLTAIGSKIESLSFDYWIDGGQDRLLAVTPKLVHLSLGKQYAEALVAKLATPSSVHLARLSIEVRPMPGFGRANWPRIDAVLATPQFRALRRISFTDQITKRTVVTAEPLTVPLVRPTSVFNYYI